MWITRTWNKKIRRFVKSIQYIKGTFFYALESITCHFMKHAMKPKKAADQAILQVEAYSDSQFFLFLNLGYLGVVGRKYGENSQQYSDAIVDNDMQTARLVDALKSLGIYDETLVMITIDHGFTENGYDHGTSAPDTLDLWLATNFDLSADFFYQQDIAPTIYDLFGVDWSAFQPTLIGDSLVA